MLNARTIGAVSLLVIAGFATLFSGCGSLGKDDLESALLALEKNASARESGVERISVNGAILGEGRFLRVAARSDSGRGPVVLVHGTPGSLFNWTELLFSAHGGPALNDTRDVYALDVIGHGVTRTTHGPTTFQGCADYLVAFLEALSVDDVCLVGNSYGGEFVWRAALDRPDLITRVVLLDASGYARTDEQFLPEEVAMRENPLAPIGWRLNSRDRIRTALQPHFGREVSADQLEEMFLVCDNADNWRAMVDLARDENGTRADELSSLSQPTLLLWGDRDFAYPAESFGRRFETDIPNAELHVISDCGHYPQEERPAVVAERLRLFLSVD